MEQKLLKVFKLADKLNTKQSKVYAEINYSANDSQKLEFIIRSKMRNYYNRRFGNSMGQYYFSF